MVSILLKFDVFRVNDLHLIAQFQEDKYWRQCHDCPLCKDNSGASERDSGEVDPKLFGGAILPEDPSGHLEIGNPDRWRQRLVGFTWSLEIWPLLCSVCHEIRNVELAWAYGAPPT